MHFYSRGLLELYKQDSYRGISAKTNINYMSVANGINAAKEEFKKKIKTTRKQYFFINIKLIVKLEIS